MKLLFGADPEYVFDFQGELFPASLIAGSRGGFGHDGHPDTAELRPFPAPNSLQLVVNIQTLLEEAFVLGGELLGKMGFLAGHYKHEKPLGGHVHVSFSEPVDLLLLCELFDLIQIPWSNLVDDLKERERRWGFGYGKTGLTNSHRVQQAHKWVEYRVPGSWLISPQIAFLSVWLLETTTRWYINNVNSVSEGDVFTGIKTLFVKELLGRGQEVTKIPTFITNAEKVKGVTNYELASGLMKKLLKELEKERIDWGIDFKFNWGLK